MRTVPQVVGERPDRILTVVLDASASSPHSLSLMVARFLSLSLRGCRRKSTASRSSCGLVHSRPAAAQLPSSSSQYLRAGSAISSRHSPPMRHPQLAAAAAHRGDSHYVMSGGQKFRAGVGLGHCNILPGRRGRASQIRWHLLMHQSRSPSIQRWQRSL